jgi:hypothetical protein
MIEAQVRTTAGSKILFAVPITIALNDSCRLISSPLLIGCNLSAASSVLSMNKLTGA